MTPGLPTYFISHGAPDILLSEHAAVAALHSLPERYSRPKAIVVVSAHWRSGPIGITHNKSLGTIHDYYGFPSELYEMRYPAHGDESLSAHIHSLLQSYGLTSELVNNRGLDHGAWVPLKIIYPEADIPVVQVSLPDGPLDKVMNMGQALASLPDEGVLVIGSGGSTHNLHALNTDNKTERWAYDFENWLVDAVESHRFEWLMAPEHYTESFQTAHPTIEHYAPLVFAWASAGAKSVGRRIHNSFSYGNLGMSIFEFK